MVHGELLTVYFMGFEDGMRRKDPFIMPPCLGTHSEEPTVTVKLWSGNLL